MGFLSQYTNFHNDKRCERQFCRKGHYITHPPSFASLLHAAAEIVFAYCVPVNMVSLQAKTLKQIEKFQCVYLVAKVLSIVRGSIAKLFHFSRNVRQRLFSNVRRHIHSIFTKMKEICVLCLLYCTKFHYKLIILKILIAIYPKFSIAIRIL